MIIFAGSIVIVVAITLWFFSKWWRLTLSLNMHLWVEFCCKDELFHWWVHSWLAVLDRSLSASWLMWAEHIFPLHATLPSRFCLGSAKDTWKPWTEINLSVFKLWVLGILFQQQEGDWDKWFIIQYLSSHTLISLNLEVLFKLLISNWPKIKTKIPLLHWTSPTRLHSEKECWISAKWLLSGKWIEQYFWSWSMCCRSYSF